MADRLPNELLEAIFSLFHTPGPCDFVRRSDIDLGSQTLANACRASKRFCEVIRPILYSNLNFANEADSDVKLVLQTVCHYPLLRRAVRSICLGLWDPRREFDGPDDQNPVIPPNIEVLQLYNTSIEHASVPEFVRERLRRNFSVNHADANVALLLAWCTNLQQLTFLDDYRLEALSNGY